MPIRISSKDIDVFMTVAEYRVLTVEQISLLLGRNQKSIYRRLNELEKHNLLLMLDREAGHGRGRPENLFVLTEDCIRLLKGKGSIDHNIRFQKILFEQFNNIDHQLLLNWFCIHLIHLEKQLPRLTIKFYQHNSPFLPKAKVCGTFITDSVQVSNQIDKPEWFTPDMVFSISDNIMGKSLLYFLEVDCGTETIASPKRAGHDIRQKIVNYGAYFDNEGYKRYEQIWESEFRGFRLLFLTNASSRLSNLSKLVRDIPCTDFVWLAEQYRMFADGIGAHIWARGGNTERGRESILDSSSCRSPVVK